MTKDEKQFIAEIVAETIAQLQRAGMLRPARDMAYKEASERLRKYYDDGERDKLIAAALDKVESDPYYKIIPLFFRYGYTLPQIAEVFGVEISTVSRNKKRLSLRILQEIE